MNNLKNIIWIISWIVWRNSLSIIYGSIAMLLVFSAGIFYAENEQAVSIMLGEGFVLLILCILHAYTSGWQGVRDMRMYFHKKYAKEAAKFQKENG